MKRKWITGLLCLTMSMTLLMGCEGKTKSTDTADTTSSDTKAEVEVKNEGDPIVLASMTDEESQIYGELMKQVLEANGYEVDAAGVGTYNNTTLPRQSLMEGQVDIVQDYTGRGMMFVKDADPKAYTTDLQTAFETTKKADAENGLAWLCYSPYNNSDGICVKADWAKENGIEDFSDFAEYINNGGEMKIAIATENSYVTTESTCIPGWEKTYGFKLTQDQLVVGVSDPQSICAKGTDGVLAANCYTTGGTIDALGLYVIKDPEYVSPIYSPAAICRQEVLDKYPELQDIMTPMFEAIDEEIIRDMNKKLSTDGESAADLAAQFLKSEGFVK